MNLKRKIKKLKVIIMDKLTLIERYILPDALYLKKFYKKRMGKLLDLKNPKTIGEKIQWLKLYDRNPLYTKLADKYRCRDYVEEKLGPGYTVPLLGVWQRAKDVDFDKLPNQFVIKTNHDGTPIICKDKSNFNFDEARKKLNQKLHSDYSIRGREWAYKNIKRCIIAEEFLGDGKTDLLDYKFFCFDGEPKFLYVSTHPNPEDVKTVDITHFDMDFNRLKFRRKGYNAAPYEIKKPEYFDKMKEFARKLSEGIPFVRVDMYFHNDEIFIGEMTFYPTNGMIEYEPKEEETIQGSYITLPENNIRN